MALSSDHQLAPAQIEKADFPTAFRGFDQDAVRRYLHRLASAIEHQQKFAALGDLDPAVATQDRIDELEEETGALRAENAKLERRLAETERRNDELTAARRDHASPSFDDLDDASLIELLGRETARVLESARTAAADIVGRAESRAADIERDAQDAMIKARREARNLVAQKKSEADALVAKVADEAELKARAMTEEARRHREGVIEESTRLMAETEAQAGAEEAAARLRSARIVADSEAARRHMLAELVVEGARLRSELDAVADARDQLRLALSVARSELDVMLDDLDGTTDDSPGAIPPTVDVDAAVDALIADLEKRHPGNDDHVVAHTNGSDGDTGPYVEEATDEVDQEVDDEVNTDDGAGDGIDDDLDDAIDDGAGDGTGNDLDDGRGASAGPTDSTDGPDVDSDADPGAASERNGASIDLTDSGLVDGFQTIDLGDDDLEGDGPSSSSKRGGPEHDDHIITTVASRVDTGGAKRSRGDLLIEEPFSGRLPAQFKARDMALTKHGPNFRRQLRRALNDDQSDVLDRLRAGRGGFKVSELPALTEQKARYIEPLQSGLLELSQAGLRAGGGRRLSKQAVTKLVDQLAGYIVDRVRTPTVEALESATDTDRERILEPVRAHYREFRNTSLTELADDALYEAFAIGVFQSIDEGAEVRWVVDPRSDPDPICDINAAREELRKGESFPSGHARPLALSNCRCLVVKR